MHILINIIFRKSCGLEGAVCLFAVIYVFSTQHIIIITIRQRGAGLGDTMLPDRCVTV